MWRRDPSPDVPAPPKLYLLHYVAFGWAALVVAYGVLRLGAASTGL